jgi:hypothetical protein
MQPAAAAPVLDGMKLRTLVAGPIPRKGTPSFDVWSVMGVLTLCAMCYFRYSEGPNGPWTLAGAAGMASLFGIVDGMGNRRALSTRLILVLFIAVGAASGWDTAQIRHGYVAIYGFATAWLLFFIDLAIGLIASIFKGSRIIGKRVATGGTCRLAAFYAVIVLAHATGHTRWHELKHSVKIPPTQPQ